MSENKTIINCPNGKDACPIYDKVAELHREIETLRSEVTLDFLTSLYNKRFLDICLNQELERTLRSRQPTTVVMLDIDHFKKVNDTWGHVAGDVVLQHVAKILINSVRKLDVCCRSGGEEFTIVLPSTPMLIGIQVAERIRQYLEATAIEVNGGEINVTASLGVNSFQHHSGMSQQAFLESVDEQLYRAKKAGRNQVCFATPQEEYVALQVSSDERAALFGTSTEEKNSQGEGE